MKRLSSEGGMPDLPRTRQLVDEPLGVPQTILLITHVYYFILLV